MTRHWSGTIRLRYVPLKVGPSEISTACFPKCLVRDPPNLILTLALSPFDIKDVFLAIH